MEEWNIQIKKIYMQYISEPKNSGIFLYIKNIYIFICLLKGIVLRKINILLFQIIVKAVIGYKSYIVNKRSWLQSYALLGHI